MKVITICGSLKFKQNMTVLAEKLSLEGYCVLAPVWPVNLNRNVPDESLKFLKDAHFKRIEMSDAILVADIDNYIGDSTRSEIEYAENLGKEIIYYTDFEKDCNLNINSKDIGFWQALDDLVDSSEIIVDRPKGTVHPKYPDLIYPVDYGYLKGTSSMDGSGIDVWIGSGDKKIDAVVCTVDLIKRDSEIKILIGCTEGEKNIIYRTHNNSKFMRGVLIRR